MKSELSNGAVGQLVLLAAPALLLKFFRLVAPARSLSVTADQRQRYLGWQLPELIAYVSFSVVCTIAAFVCLRFLAVVLARPRFASLVVLEPVPALWWLSALFLGVVLAAWPTSRWLRHAIGPESDTFERFEDQRYGIDSRRLSIMLAWTFGLAAVMALLVGITKTDQLTTQGIVIGEAFVAHPPLRPYSTVRTITHGTYSRRSARGRARVHDWFNIAFDDGTEWRSRYVLWDVDDRLLVKTVIELVSARSGRPIEER